MRPLLITLLAVTLAACTSDEAGDGTLAPDSVVVEGDTMAAVGDPGLTAAQTDSLLALGYPVLVPSDPGAFRLDSAEVEAEPPYYSLYYGRDDGACVTITGATEGFGGPGLPEDSLVVEIPALGRTLALHHAVTPDDAESWGEGAIISEWLDLDGMLVHVITRDEGACRGLPMDEAAAFVGGLRTLAAE